MTGRNDINERRNPGCARVWGKAQRERAYRLSGVRPEGGVISIQAATRNVGTSSTMKRETLQVGSPHESKSTKAATRDGVARSSNEAFESKGSEGAPVFHRHAAATPTVA